MASTGRNLALSSRSTGAALVSRRSAVGNTRRTAGASTTSRAAARWIRLAGGAFFGSVAVAKQVLNGLGVISECI